MISSELVRRMSADARAITVPDTKTCILFTDRGYAGNCFDARHEFAHAMADICGCERVDSLRKSYDAISLDLLNRFLELKKNRALSEEEFQDLRSIRRMLENRGDQMFHEAVADAYAVTFGGSRGAEFDMIFKDKFDPMIKLLQDEDWYRAAKVN